MARPQKWRSKGLSLVIFIFFFSLRRQLYSSHTMYLLFFPFFKISLGFLVLPWERGLSFRNWLKALKHFTTNQKWRFHEIPALAVPNTNLVPRVNWSFEIYARIVIGQTTTCHLVLVLQHKNLSQNKKPRSVIWVFVLSICAHNP